MTLMKIILFKHTIFSVALIALLIACTKAVSASDAVIAVPNVSVGSFGGPGTYDFSHHAGKSLSCSNNATVSGGLLGGTNSVYFTAQLNVDATSAPFLRVEVYTNSTMTTLLSDSDWVQTTSLKKSYGVMSGGIWIHPEYGANASPYGLTAYVDGDKCTANF